MSRFLMYVQIPNDAHAHLTGRHFLQVKKSCSWCQWPNNVVFVMPVDFKQTKANHWKPFTFVICNLQSQGCIQITVLECIIQCLIILGNDFPFYIYNGFQHTSMPKQTSMLKTEYKYKWAQGKIIHVIYDFTLYSYNSFQHMYMFWHNCILKAIMPRYTHNECIWIVTQAKSLIMNKITRNFIMM